MKLRLFNALTGRPEDFEPSIPPACRLRVLASPNVESLGGLRFARFCVVAETALSYLGLQLSPVRGAKEEVDIHLSLREPAGRALLWLKPDPRVEGEGDTAAVQALGFDGDILALAFLRQSYRKPLALTQAALEAAREDALRLQATASYLRSTRAGTAPNIHALAGYKKRLRDALARDLDFPDALACLWDALRPGALSPGTQLAFLREAAGALDLRGL